MKIYLDTCTICRPFDSIDQLRIRFEAEASAAIVKLAEEDKITLVASAALLLESNRNPAKKYGVMRLPFCQSLHSLWKKIKLSLNGQDISRKMELSQWMPYIWQAQKYLESITSVLAMTVFSKKRVELHR